MIMEQINSKVNQNMFGSLDEMCLTRVNYLRRTVYQSVNKYLIFSNNIYKNTLCNIYCTVLLLTILIYPCTAAHTWESPGCHKVGHTRLIQVPGCVKFNITLNACRGFCKSFAIPSPSQTLRVNAKHEITSRAECCSIKETHDVKVLVSCINGERELIFKSAKTCSCSICFK